MKEAKLVGSGPPLIIMHSDGIATISALDRYPGIENRHPAMIAGIVYRDFMYPGGRPSVFQFLL